MTSPPSPLPLLTVRQHRRAHFHALVGPVPAVVLVESGAKTVSGEGFRVTIPAGGIGLLPDRLPLHVENRPPEDGVYQARMIGIDRTRFARAEATAGLSPPGMPPRIGLDTPSEGLRESFERLTRSLQDSQKIPPTVLDLMVAELITWLAEEGLRLCVLPAPSFGEQVRRVLEASPDQDWKADHLASQLAISEPTMRRRLRAEGLTFLDILIDVRMTQALSLLQSTEWSVAAVALSVGYESPSRFASRFRDRFGLQPHEIRMKDKHFDRISADIDRSGRARPVIPA